MFSTYRIRVSDKTVGKLLHQLGYSLQAAKKTVEGAQHPDRNAQFEHINAQAKECIERGIPFISVDTKKKELVGNFKNAGVEWQPKDEPELVDVHDFPSDAIGKAIPYGVYDVASNHGFVNIGTDHDTPVFAVTSIETWWKRMGSQRYPNAKEIFITADAGGSTAIGPACGNSSCSASLTNSGSRSTSAISRPAPASGTRSSIVSSRSSR